MGHNEEITEPICSTPALAAAIRETHSRTWPTSISDMLLREPLQPFYQIQAKSQDAEARAAAHLVSEIAERLRRLGDAYGEWNPFDPSAYFDFSRVQAEHLVHVVERVSTVHITLFVDPLLPSFQQAESFWANHFFPAYHSAYSPHSGVQSSSRSQSPSSDHIGQNSLGSSNGSNPNGSLSGMFPESSAFTDDFKRTICPAMIDHWNRLLSVGQQARRLLADHIGYLAVNGSQEERARWRSAWATPSPILESNSDLYPDYQTLPTLTLSIEFPLPLGRQPGRQQRLKLNRQRRRQDRR